MDILRVSFSGSILSQSQTNRMTFMRNQRRPTRWKQIASLLVLGVAILGLTTYFIISQMAQGDTVLKSFQLPQKIPSSKPLFSKSERAFPLPPELNDYEVIVENDLFRPLGWQKEIQLPEELTSTVIPEPIVEILPPPPTYTLVLTGIAKNGSDWIAVVEDRQQNEGAFFRRGEMLKDVHVQDIMSEHITLTRGEKTVQLALGESIEYGIDGRLRFDTTGAAKMSELPNETGTLSETQADSDDDGEQSLIEQMRARRRKELD